MRRRNMLATTGAAMVALGAFPLGWVTAAEKKKQKLLYFTRSAGYEHAVVKRTGDALAFSEKTLTELGKRAGFDVECSKDGAIFDGDLAAYDCIAFYTSGDLTQPAKSPQPGAPMSPEGKKRLLDAIAAGKPFVGIHAATDTFLSAAVDPYIAMIGGEFIPHGPQQKGTVKVTSPKFPGIGSYDSLTLVEEWYPASKFAKDLHVILLQVTEGMTGNPKTPQVNPYDRPPFPATWARMHGQGRVFYTSFGHREDVWTNPQVQQIMLGGIAWAMHNVDADITTNIDKVAPGANQLTNRRP